jgi:hypothetical protein
VAAGEKEWSEERHAAFPPAFRQAARALLLANHRMSIAGLTSGLGAELLRQILQLASRPLPIWVPELRPMLQEQGA